MRSAKEIAAKLGPDDVVAMVTTVKVLISMVAKRIDPLMLEDAERNIWEMCHKKVFLENYD